MWHLAFLVQLWMFIVVLSATWGTHVAIRSHGQAVRLFRWIRKRFDVICENKDWLFFFKISCLLLGKRILSKQSPRAEALSLYHKIKTKNASNQKPKPHTRLFHLDWNHPVKAREKMPNRLFSLFLPRKLHFVISNHDRNIILPQSPRYHNFNLKLDTISASHCNHLELRDSALTAYRKNGSDQVQWQVFWVENRTLNALDRQVSTNRVVIYPKDLGFDNFQTKLIWELLKERLLWKLNSWEISRETFECEGENFFTFQSVLLSSKVTNKFQVIYHCESLLLKQILCANQQLNSIIAKKDLLSLPPTTNRSNKLFSGRREFQMSQPTGGSQSEGKQIFDSFTCTTDINGWSDLMKQKLFDLSRELRKVAEHMTA